MEKKPNMVFAGSSEFAIPVLEGLIQQGFTPDLILTKPARTHTRGKRIQKNPVKLFYKNLSDKLKKSINLLEVMDLHDQAVLQKIKQTDCQVMIVACFGLMIPDNVLTIPKYGCLNLHPSLLPKYRGPSPIQTAILNNESKTGVSVIKLTSEMDAGPILAQKPINIPANADSVTLSQILAQASAKLLIQNLMPFLENKIKLEPQNHDQATYTILFTKKHGHINWQKKAQDILNQIQAFKSWPGSYTFYTNQNKNQTIKIDILEAAYQKSSAQKKQKPGTVICNKNISDYPLVQTGKGLLELIQIKPQNKKAMSALAFINGYPGFINSELN
ncbi:MAG: methionyl-tRNA formyltransferase [Candidatus Moranbacteria bacterium]|nr:methionyl-tRNA formyltransferase [Candidatus Moranbacteria bacterium]